MKAEPMPKQAGKHHLSVTGKPGLHEQTPESSAAPRVSASDQNRERYSSPPWVRACSGTSHWLLASSQAACR
jgi:hypothetical protein